MQEFSWVLSLAYFLQRKEKIIMRCNFCGKELTKAEELLFGNRSHKFGYGSPLDGIVIRYSLCSKCANALSGLFIRGSAIRPRAYYDGLPVDLDDYDL